jgi:hypothetical protein
MALVGACACCRAAGLPAARAAVPLPVRLHAGLLHPPARLLQERERLALHHQLQRLHLPRVPGPLAGVRPPGASCNNVNHQLSLYMILIFSRKGF